MLHRMYTVFDVKSELHSTPILLATEMQALRSFTNMANDPSNDVGRNPEDYSLWWIADYEDTTGTVIALPTKKCVAHAIDMRKSKTDWLDPNEQQAFKDAVLGVLMQANQEKIDD